MKKFVFTSFILIMVACGIRYQLSMDNYTYKQMDKKAFVKECISYDLLTEFKDDIFNDKIESITIGYYDFSNVQDLNNIQDIEILQALKNIEVNENNYQQAMEILNQNIYKVYNEDGKIVDIIRQ